MGLIGSTLEWTTVFPMRDNVFFGPFEVTPGPGTEDFEFIEDNGINEVWDISDRKIQITYTEDATAANKDAQGQTATHNAEVLSDVGNTVQDFQKVKILNKKTTGPWEDSMIEWTADEIVINYLNDGEGISLATGDVLTLKVVFDRTSASLGDDLMKGTGGTDRFKGLAGDDKIIGRGGDDKLFGSKGDDIIKGSKGDDKVVGNGGADSLYGNGGKDKLVGGKGADFLAGGGGRDVLIGGKGKDDLKGGGGSDKFVFKKTTGRDKIEDFQDGKDIIVLKKWGVDDFDDLTIKERDNGVLLKSDKNTILLQDMDIADIGADDFIF